MANKEKKETTKTPVKTNKSYIPAGPEQVKSATEPTSKVLGEKTSDQLSNKSAENLAPKNYTRVTEFWTNQQKQKTEENEESIQEGHNQYSAY